MEESVSGIKTTVLKVNPMGSKHDILTEEELHSHGINPIVRKALAAVPGASGPPEDRSRINILDWGCGRGRTVLTLRDEGFNSYGIDIDESVMRNGHALLKSRGLNPTEILRPAGDTGEFDDGYFHFIFSEQVFEHVEDLRGVLTELYRLTCSGGTGVHCFPGSKTVQEEHLCMPFVHWLPKNCLRKAALAVFLFLGYGPTPPWPEVNDQGFWGMVQTYYDYLNRKTYYRSVDQIDALAREAGFTSVCRVKGPETGRKKCLPGFLVNNGFPRSPVTLFLAKGEP